MKLAGPQRNFEVLMSVIVCKKIFSFVPLYGSVFTNVAGAVVKLATPPKTPLFSRALAEKTKKKKIVGKTTFKQT